MLDSHSLCILTKIAIDLDHAALKVPARIFIRRTDNFANGQREVGHIIAYTPKKQLRYGVVDVTIHYFY
jgi:hypothetical protein